MKRPFLLMATLLLIVFLAACGTQNNDEANNADQADEGTMNNEDQNNDNNTDDQNDDENMDNEDNTTDNNKTDAASNDDMKQKMDELDYTDFELEVDYGDNKEYEAKIEIDDDDNNRVEADLEDDINGVDINGQEAFNKIHPKVKKLTIDANTSKKDAIMEALKAFDLDPDYNKFELELTFKDGKKVEFEDKK